MKSEELGTRPASFTLHSSLFTRAGLAVATVAAFALRVWDLASLGDLDFDEQASSFIGSMPPPDMLRYLLGAPFEHPPFFYLLFHAWLAAAGDSETAMRVFSALLGTATVPLVGVTVGSVAGARAGLVACAIMAVAPLHVFYSRDARMYPLLALLMALMLALAVVRWGRPARQASPSTPAMGVAAPAAASSPATGVAARALPAPPTTGGAARAFPSPPAGGEGEGEGGRAPATRWSLSHLRRWVAARGLRLTLIPGKTVLAGAREGTAGRAPTLIAPASRLMPRQLRWLALGATAAAALATHYYALLGVCGMAGGALIAGWLAGGPGTGRKPPLLPAPKLTALLALAVGAGAVVWIASSPGLRTSLTVAYPRPVDPARLVGVLASSLGSPMGGPLASPEAGAAVGLLTAAALAGAALSWRRAWRAAAEQSAISRQPSAVSNRPSAISNQQSGVQGTGESASSEQSAALEGSQHSALSTQHSALESARALWWMAFGGFVAVTVGVPLLLLVGRAFAPRFVVLAVPFLAILLALGTVGWPGRALAAAGAVAGAVSVVGLAPAYLEYTRSDYGRAMAELRGLARAEDGIVLNGPWQDLLYRRYGWGLPPRYIIASTVPLREREAVGWLERLSNDHPRLWVVDSATDAADPNGVVERWLDTHAYPRPVIGYRKALLRPYLTDYAGAPALDERSIAGEVLGLKLQTVALDRWTIEAGGEARVRIRLAPACPNGSPGCEGSSLRPPGATRDVERRLSVQLVGPGGQTEWHWDGPLVPARDRLEYRAALVVPGDLPGGLYSLQVTGYEREGGPSGTARILRLSEAVEVARVEVISH